MNLGLCPWGFSITLVFILKFVDVYSVSNGGTCTSNDDCDANTGLKCYMYNDGVTNCPTGTCGCGENRVWLTSYCGTPAGVIGQTCVNNDQCTAVVTNSQCVSHRCGCPTGYYCAGSYRCLPGPGTVALNNVCTNSNHCNRNLICTRCPGVSSGDMHCRSESGTVSVKFITVWISVLPISYTLLLFI